MKKYSKSETHTEDERSIIRCQFCENVLLKGKRAEGIIVHCKCHRTYLVSFTDKGKNVQLIEDVNPAA